MVYLSLQSGLDVGDHGVAQCGVLLLIAFLVTIHLQYLEYDERNIANAVGVKVEC